MAHKWNAPVNRHVQHAVTCQLCGVFVERVFEDKRGVNYNTVAGGARVRGLAPKCPGAIVIAIVEEDPNQGSLFDVNELELAADAAPEEAPAEDEEPADEDEDGDEVVIVRTDEEPVEDDDALTAHCAKYEGMTRKELDKLAAGRVKNYKKLTKDALALELAFKSLEA